MLFMASNLTCRRGVFYFRARVPTHLVSAYGRSIVSVSLRTRDPSTAKARARLKRVELECELSALQQDGSTPVESFRGTVLHLSDADIDRICEQYRVKELAEDELRRIKGMSIEQLEHDLDFYETGLPFLRQAYAAGSLKEVHKSLRFFLKSIGLNLQRSSPAMERLARRFQQAELEVHEAIAQRRQGIAVGIPVVASDTFSIDAVLACWKSQKPSAAQNLKTIRSFEQIFAEFKTHCQAPTARLVKRADAIAFRKYLSARGDRSPQTIAKQIGFLRAAFQCAVNDDEIEANPFAGVKVLVPETASTEKSRLPFTTTELQKIFSGPVYQPGHKPRESLGQACYWLPLLGLYTGARLEELAQLEASDIEHDAKSGAYVCIRRVVDKGKRTKNVNSVRNFPVHPMLVRLGFLRYVKACSPGRLFPALRHDKYGTLSTSFSTWFGRHLDELGITDSTRVFHSFRHAFIEAGKQHANVIPPEVREAIVGHMSAKKIEMLYGSQLYPLAPQCDAMKRIDWPELDIRHLIGRFGCPE